MGFTKSNGYRNSHKFTLAIAGILALCQGTVTQAASAYVRVSQIGYEAGHAPFRAYLMSASSVTGATFRVLDDKGDSVYKAAVGSPLGTWSSKKLTYQIYALDFSVPSHDIYSISVSRAVQTSSPAFPVDTPDALYPGLLLNAKFFYQTEKDGPDYVHNALRSAPGHLNDGHAAVYQTPPLDDNDNIATTGTPLTPTGSFINAPVDGGTPAIT